MSNEVASLHLAVGVAVHEREEWKLRAEAAEAELARRDALEPVAYTDIAELRFEFSMADMWKKPIGAGKDIPLFTAATAPVVSKPTLLAMIRAWNRAEFPSEAVFEEMRQILKGGAD